MFFVLAATEHLSWTLLLFHWKKKVYCTPVCLLRLLWWDSSKWYHVLQGSSRLQALICAVPFPGYSLQPFPAFKTRIKYHFLCRACQRTSIFAFITLHCNCLFTHLFPQLDSELPEVGNLLLFNFAASCWRQGSPEAERWPTLSKYVTLQQRSFPVFMLALLLPPLVLFILSTSNSCYLTALLTLSYSWKKI